MKNLNYYLKAAMIHTGCLWPDELYVRCFFCLSTGKWPNLNNPKGFMEKIQWLKLHDRRKEMVRLVDKIEAKAVVKQLIGDGYIIPNLYVYNNPSEIEWEKLPNQFVIKCTHDSGGVVVCRDKETLDVKSAIKKINSRFYRNYYWPTREYPYKHIKPRILVEQFMQSSDTTAEDLADYKFYCFNGVPRFCQVIKNRSKGETIDFFDMNWNHQEFRGLTPGVSNSSIEIEKPVCFAEMQSVAAKLAKDYKFVRIDLYEINGHVYFGEMTFYPASGWGVFSPENYDRILGDMIDVK